MLSGCQIRAGRALLQMSQLELSELTKISCVSLGKMESVDGNPPARKSNLQKIRKAFLAKGVYFTENTDALSVHFDKATMLK
jgi:transcriptional regulator with XRE-family HTH domain